MNSIFQAGGALPADHTTYVERQADHDALHAALDGEYLHVIAPRQIGKTSLLKRLATRLSEMGWRCAYVDLSTLMDFPKPAWYAELGKALALNLTPGQVPTLSNQVDLRCYLLDQALPWPNSQPCIALFLDEVEGAGKARDTDGTHFSDTFFMTLRNLYIQRDNYGGTLVVALAGAVDPSDLVKDPDISPFNVGREIGLDDFTSAETRVLTDHLADLNLPVDEAVHQAIYNWASGHPYLTQRICAELEKAARDGSLTALTPDHVDHVVEQVILNPVSPLQQDKNLRHVAKMLSRLSAPAAELWSRLRAGESISRREAADDLYLELYLTGVVKAQAGRLVIRNRIYAQTFGEQPESESRPLYEEYAERILIAFYEAHQDPQYPGVRAHGLPGIILATRAGIVSADEWQTRGYWTSRKRWDIVAALRELVDRGYIKRTEDDLEEHGHPDDWNFRLTPQGKSYARELLGERGGVDVAPTEQVSSARSLRIFVSSTWEDLQPEREAVEKALHRMQDTAFAGMEYFGSRPETPKEVSLAEVDRSDVYIGIFAHRYGSGITEAEYRRARERGLPCLIYLKDDSVPVPPAHIERDSAKAAKLEALKGELKVNHTVSFFKSPDHLATQVVADLHNLLGSAPSAREDEPPQRGPKYQIHITDSQGIVIGDQAQVSQQFGAPAPSQWAEPLKAAWPANIPDERYYPLPGRERDLDQLLKMLQDPKGPPVIVIDGLGGLGKTAMAVELSRRALRQNLFEGVVGDSAKQELLTGGEIVQVREATLDFDSLLDAIARQLGRWEMPTLKAEEKRAALTHLLRQHRYLVLVDNLETAENANALVAHLRGFLDGSRAIVTSRKKVRHDFVHALSLQELGIKDSLFFLQTDAEQRGVQQILGAPEEKLGEIHEITGGAPLALKLVVAQARFLDLDLILRRLRQAGGDLYPFIFRQSWEQLSPAAQRALIYIGRTVVTTVSWEELASVDVAENEGELVEAIDQLVAYSLLEVSFVASQARYGIHQLTRHFVNSDLPEMWRKQGLL